MSRKNGVIQVVGARQHNLKNIDVELPRNKISVCSGPSGSGKSSLAIDTIYAEGQRRYVESLSAYARQFLSRLQPPRVDHVHGLSPAICIEQKNASKSPRSTVGTVTEIYDYMRILWGRIGTPYCPKCKTPIGTQTSDEIVEKLLALGDGTKVVLLAPVAPTGSETYPQLLQRASANGFIRARVDGEMKSLDEAIAIDHKRRHRVELVVDRIIVRRSQRARISDSVEQALSIGDGVMLAQPFEDAARAASSAGDLRFSQHRSCAQCSRSFEELTPHHFSFNSRMGWCSACEGLGIQQGASPAAIVVHPTRSILDGAIAGWDTPAPGSLLYALASAVAGEIGFSPEMPWNQLSETQQLEFLHGTGDRWIEVAPTALTSTAPATAARPNDVDIKQSPKRQRGVALQAGTRFPSRPSVQQAAGKDSGERGCEKGFSHQQSADVGRRQPVACARGSDLRVKWRGFFPAINRATRSSWQYRKRLEDLVTDVPCEACSGGRLRPDAAAVRVGGKTIQEVCRQPLAACLKWFEGLRLSRRERRISGELLHEVASRLRFLVEVGLDYVSLHRTAATLSGGEAQRIQLASQIGTGLTGVLYVLDEPTIGLHPRDNARLIRAMRRLRGLGNTLVVVEHDREVIESADYVLDFGPGAGALGGQITAAASPKQLRSKRASLTGRYLSGKEAIPVPTNRRPVRHRLGAEPQALACATPQPEPQASACATRSGTGTQESRASELAAPSIPSVSRRLKPAARGAGAPRGLKPAAQGASAHGASAHDPWNSGIQWLVVHGAREHNLQEIDVAFPLSRFTCVTGVSGSGKSTLVTEILYNALASRIHRARLVPGGHDRITGIDLIDKVINVDQSPIGISPTSNPATYTGVFDSIRELYAKLPLSKVRGYGPQRFSFNRAGGRCEVCEGMGQRCIEMHFLPDVWVECEHCNGSRYVPQTLEVQYLGKSIADVLTMSISEALALLKNIPRVRRMLQTLDDVGLGYLQLGQSAPTLSGGEAQRVKLAAELGRPSTGKTVYMLDEPTTGLHFDDLKKLLNVLHRLVDLGNTCICIEHNLDVIKTADWVIDLGPEAGENGGTIVAEGPPEQIVRVKHSHTGAALKPVMDAGPHEQRAVHDRRRRKKAEAQAVEPIDLGSETRMPWERNGKAWHTVDHIDRQGTSVEWDPKLLLWLVETIESLGDFEPTDWNHQALIEVKAKGKQPWFCHILTGGRNLIEVAIRVGARTFGALSLAKLLPVKTLDERTDLPIYGRTRRVKLRRPTLGWQEVRLFLRDFQDIQKPTAREFLKRAVDAYSKKIAETQERPEQSSPWTADGKQWHLSQRAIRRKSSIRWKPALLMAVIGRFKSVESNLSVEWDHQTAVQLAVPGEDRFAGKIVTNLARGLRVELRAPSGVITPTQVDRLGQDVEIKRHPAYDRVTFWLQSLADNDSKQLREVWRLCRMGGADERLRSA